MANFLCRQCSTTVFLVNTQLPGSEDGWPKAPVGTAGIRTYLTRIDL